MGQALPKARSATSASGLHEAFKARLREGTHKKLAAYGLRYEDILLTNHPDYQTALKYIPPEEYQQRLRRIKRAIDMSFKHEYLPLEIQAIQEPGKSYLGQQMIEARALREEREELNRS